MNLAWANHTGCETPTDVPVINIQPEDAASSSLLASEISSFQHVQGLGRKQLGKCLVVLSVFQVLVTSFVCSVAPSLGTQDHVADEWVCSWLTSGRDPSGWKQWKPRQGHNKGQYQLFSSLLKARWHLCSCLQLSSTLPTAVKSKIYLLISMSLGYCPLAPWLSLTLGLSLPLCGMSPGASSPFKFCLLWFYPVSLRVWLVATSVDLSGFRLSKSMVENDLWDCRTDHEQVLRGGFEVN